MYRMEQAFSRILGVKPAFMRPPYGDYNTDVEQVAKARNQSLALWDTDTGDADGNTVAQSETVYKDAVSSKPSNLLVLNHETEATTAGQLIPYAIKLLQGDGYNLVTMAECLGLDPYFAIGVPQSGTWSCDDTPAPGDGCSGSITCETGVPSLSTTASSSTKTTTTTTKTTTTTTILPTPTGKTIRPGASSSLCLTAASNTNNAAVTVNTCSSTSSNQRWVYTSTPGTISIFDSKCLDVPNGSTANGQAMQIYTCNVGSVNTNQQWYVTGDDRIAWNGKGECLDLTGGSKSSGTVAQMWHCTTGDTNQVWNFV